MAIELMDSKSEVLLNRDRRDSNPAEHDEPETKVDIPIHSNFPIQQGFPYMDLPTSWWYSRLDGLRIVRPKNEILRMPVLESRQTLLHRTN